MGRFSAILFCLLPSMAGAADFSINWSSIAAGGGASSGGAFVLVGTIGQHDADSLSGGDYTVDSGFLSGIILVQAAGAPRLSIQFLDGQAVLWWNAESADGFVLEETADLNDPASWRLSAAEIVGDELTKSANASTSGGLRFFRLRKPNSTP